MRSRFAVTLGALALDLLLGEPPRPIHPVIWVGRAVDRIGKLAPNSSRAQLAFGAAHLAAIVTLFSLATQLARRLLERLPTPFGALGEVWLLKTTLSVRELCIAALRVQRALESDQVDLARAQARALVSRDVSALDAPLLASAAVESVAENLSDSIVAPLVYHALGGVTAAMAYRVVNTMDAMIGYHGGHEYLGKAAARTDDVLNYVPSRIAAWLIVAAAGLAGGDVAGARQVLARDGGRTASPNAGRPMSAMSGALGVSLQKPGHYRIGDPLPMPDTASIDHAVRVLGAATLLALPLLWALSRPFRPRLEVQA